jgi:AAA domain
MNTKLEQLVSSGRHQRPSGQCWYGQEGTRKTGSAVSPKTLILDLEHGSDQYDCDRIHVDTYRDLLQALDLIIREKSKHEIIVLDPIEIGEKLLIGETCRQLKIDGLQGLPHGAAWQFLRENFDAQLMTRFSEIRRTGRHMVVIGHAQVRTVTLPGLAEAFDRFELRIDRQNANTLVEWADHVLFFDWDVRVAKNREGIVRALSNSDPIIRVVHGPGWIAKNRVGLAEPLKAEFASLAPLFNNAVAVQETATHQAPVTAPPAPTPPTDSRTIQPPPDPDLTVVEPFLSDEERHTVERFLASLPQDRLHTFLRKREIIRDDENYRVLGPHYLRRILGDTNGFKEAVERD